MVFLYNNEETQNMKKNSKSSGFNLAEIHEMIYEIISPKWSSEIS